MRCVAAAMFKDNLPERFFVLAVNGIFTTVPLTLLVGTKFLLSIAGYFVLSLFAISRFKNEEVLCLEKKEKKIDQPEILEGQKRFILRKRHSSRKIAWESTTTICACGSGVVAFSPTDTIRRELALHGRVCKYAALSALRASSLRIMARDRRRRRIDAHGPTWKTYGRRRRGPLDSLQRSRKRTKDVPFPCSVLCSVSQFFIGDNII